jgi:hypothetical protein
MCQKQRLRRKLDAKIALAKTRRGDRNSCREEQRYYWCIHCRAYHLTSEPKR